MFCLTVEKDVSTLPDVFCWTLVNKTVFLLMAPVAVRKPVLKNAMTLEGKKTPLTFFFFPSYSFKLC